MIGGLGSLTGAALGGFLVGVVTILLQACCRRICASSARPSSSSRSLLVLLFRPQGLIPARGLRERI